MAALQDLFGNDLAARKEAAKRRAQGVKLSEPLADAKIKALSLGVGLQSVVLALMSARGDLPMLDVAIFSDTGDEKRATYAYLDYLEPLLPFPVIRTKRPGATLGQHAINIANLPVTRTSSPPWYTAGPDGMLPKQCNSEFKKRPVNRELAKLVRQATGKHRLPAAPIVEQWFGMTIDELWRLAVNEKRYIHNRYPLTELRMTRGDCVTWLESRQYRIPPKSSCKYCPFQRDDQWLDMQENHPEDFADVVEFDRAIRPGFFGMTGRAFVHRQRKPIDEISFERMPGQAEADFGCGEGYCGS